MPKKERYEFPLPGDVGHSFDEQDDILNFRPEIRFVAPEHELELSDRPIDEPIEEEGVRDRTRAAINGLDGLNKLAELTGERLDKRIDTLGGLNIKLDPVVDAVQIQAMKRKFPDKADPTVMSYEDYKECLKCMEDHAAEMAAKEDNDYQAGFQEKLNNPLKNDYGIARPEIINKEGSGSGISPLDLGAFQAAAVVALFALLLPLIQLEDQKAIAQHLATAKHS